MPVPLAAIGVGLQAAGLAGSIFGRKKLPSFNTGRVNQIIEQGGEEQRRQIARLRPETDTQLKAYETGVDKSQGTAKLAREAERTRYLQELDPVTSRLLQNQTDQLKRTTFGQVPEAQQAVREALAASGGLDRGIASEKLAGVPIEASRQFAEGAAGLQQESLKTMQDALANLHSEESQAIATDLGIDRDTYTTILNTGNAALIEELNALIDESKRRTSGLVSSETQGQIGALAEASAEDANRMGIYQALSGLGGTIAGMGSKGVTEVAPAARRRTVAPRYRDTAGVMSA